MTAHTPIPRSPDRLPAGCPEEPTAEMVLRVLLEALANASELVPHGNGFALVVEVSPELLDMIAVAGANTEDAEDADVPEDDDPRELTGEDDEDDHRRNQILGADGSWQPPPTYMRPADLAFDADVWIAQADAAGMAPRLSCAPDGALVLGCAIPDRRPVNAPAWPDNRADVRAIADHLIELGRADVSLQEMLGVNRDHT
jgi:hypothetical protein